MKGSKREKKKGKEGDKEKQAGLYFRGILKDKHNKAN